MLKRGYGHRYLMESPAEPQRLEAKTDPERVRERLQLAGLRKGDAVLDVGTGTGAIARVMAGLVGRGGSVTAIDASLERVRFGAPLARKHRNLRFVQGDAYRLPFAPGHFDFVWSEFLFEYLAAPERALAEMVRVARPGARVVVADLDGNGFFHGGAPRIVEENLARVQQALVGLFDPFVGRKLFGWFRAAGLDDISVQLLPYNLHAGTATEAALENWTLKLDRLAPVVAPALGRGKWAQIRAAFLRHLRDPDTLSYSVLFMVAGTVPKGRRHDRP